MLASDFRFHIRLTALVCLLAGITSAQRPGRTPRSFYDANPVLKDRRRIAWRESSPANAGLDAKKLARASKHLALRPRARSFLVARRGALVWERYFHGATARESRNVHSVSKSILGALVGIAIERGDLKSTEQRVAGTFGDLMPKTPVTRRSLSLEHLLTMTTGLAWKEDVTEYRIQREPNWVRAILSLRQSHPPGKRFLYSTGSTHLVSALLTKASGVPTHVYAKKHLLQPLGITVERWGSPDPQGYDSGGCNVYLTPRELARLGLLFLRKGRWKGRQLVPRAWIERSWRPHQKIDGTYRYGYLWWLLRVGGHKIAVAWGHGGQFVFVIPKLDLVAVITSDTAKEATGQELSPSTFAREWLLGAVSSKSSATLHRRPDHGGSPAHFRSSVWVPWGSLLIPQSQSGCHEGSTRAASSPLPRHQRSPVSAKCDCPHFLTARDPRFSAAIDKIVLTRWEGLGVGLFCPDGGHATILCSGAIGDELSLLDPQDPCAPAVSGWGFSGGGSDSRSQHRAPCSGLGWIVGDGNPISKTDDSLR